MASPTVEREQAIRVASSDWDAGLRLARAVSRPWYRCQALAWVARFSPEVRVGAIAAEALAASACSKDKYEVVGASAWPVRAMAERGQTAGIEYVVKDILATARMIAHPVRRLDALFLLWQAMHPLGKVGRRDVQRALVESCKEASSWRAGRTLRDLALMVAADDSEEAGQIVAAMGETGYRRQAERGLASGEYMNSRPFFWVAT